MHQAAFGGVGKPTKQYSLSFLLERDIIRILLAVTKFNNQSRKERIITIITLMVCP